MGAEENVMWGHAWGAQGLHAYRNCCTGGAGCTGALQSILLALDCHFLGHVWWVALEVCHTSK
jgi:hypothetical protein